MTDRRCDERRHEPFDLRFSQSLGRGLAVLGCFGGERSVLGISDIADQLGLSRSTAHRYVVTLTELGYLEQQTDRRYRLGVRVTDLGLSVLGSIDLRECAVPFLRALREETRLATGLAVLDGVQIVYLERLRGYSDAHVELESPRGPGSRLDAYCTAAGKLLLAHLSATERVLVVEQIDFAHHGPADDRNRGVLLGELAEIAADGVAISDEESAPGILAIAAPVRDEHAEVIAAVSLIAPQSITSVRDLLGNYRSALQATAAAISGELGYSPDTI